MKASIVVDLYTVTDPKSQLKYQTLILSLLQLIECLTCRGEHHNLPTVTAHGPLTLLHRGPV